MLNDKGYATLTVDSCGTANGQACVEARNQWIIWVWSDATGALDYLAGVPDIDPQSIAVMGFSAGATVIEGAIGQSPASPMNNRFKAGIAVYGQCVILGKLSTPMLEIIGAEDRNAQRCKTHWRWDASATLLTEVEIIPGATHAFDQREVTSLTTVNGDHPAIYSREATEIAQAATLRFLDRHLGRSR